MSTLGEPIKRTIIWHLNNYGIFIDSNRLDIQYFYSSLKDLLGPGADSIMEYVYDRLRKEVGTDIKLDSATPIVDKINKILEAGAVG